MIPPTAHPINVAQGRNEDRIGLIGGGSQTKLAIIIPTDTKNLTCTYDESECTTDNTGHTWKWVNGLSKRRCVWISKIFNSKLPKLK